MKIYPTKQIQLIFHRGAKKQEQPKDRLIQDPFGLLDWRENDRAIIGFRTVEQIFKNREKLGSLITSWLKTP